MKVERVPALSGSPSLWNWVGFPLPVTLSSREEKGPVFTFELLRRGRWCTGSAAPLSPHVDDVEGSIVQRQYFLSNDKTLGDRRSHLAASGVRANRTQSSFRFTCGGAGRGLLTLLRVSLIFIGSRALCHGSARRTCPIHPEECRVRLKILRCATLSFPSRKSWFV